MSKPAATTGEQARREQKLLEKNGPVQVNPLTQRNYRISQAPQIGEAVTVVIVGPNGATQFTFAHPVGIPPPDLRPKDWCVFHTPDLPATVARAKDPNAAVIADLRAKERVRIAADTHLLELKEVGGKQVVYYPGIQDTPRNAFLSDADKAAKLKAAEYDVQLKELETAYQKSVKEGNPLADYGTRKGRIASAKSQIMPFDFLPDAVKPMEAALRAYYAREDVVKWVEDHVPSHYETKTGPTGQTRQRAISGAHNMTPQQIFDSLTEIISAVNFQASAAQPPAPPTSVLPKGDEPVPGSPTGTKAQKGNKRSYFKGKKGAGAAAQGKSS